MLARKTPILRIIDNPSANETWVATVALTPCDPTDQDGFVEPPDWVMEKYLRGIASGVISALMLQPGKPYSSLPGAQYHGRKFNEAVGLARKEVRHMFTWGAQRWDFPHGGGIRRVRACRPEGVWDELPLSDPRPPRRFQLSRIFIFKWATIAAMAA